MRNIDELIKRLRYTVETHRLENDGEYARYLWQDEKNSRKMGLNEYGCADAINILYTINDFPTDLESRKNHIKVLQSLQNPKTGLFVEETHHFMHTTAHCTAALELLDAKPLYKFKDLEKYKTVDALVELLESQDWLNNAWRDSHMGAGIYAAMKLNEEVTKQWEDAYFKWFWDNADPVTGFWKKGCIDVNSKKLYQHMGGGFHYYFNHEYAKRPVRFPEKIIDTCISLYKNKQIGDDDMVCTCDKFGKFIGFLEVDWIYCITRSLKQSGYRRQDCMDVLKDFTNGFLDWLYSIDYKTDDGFNDLHALFGTVCALAELQNVLYDEVNTTKPLRLVLDRRPFI